METPARSNRAQLVRYSATPHQLAVQLDDDGCGFCYYESSRVAVCVNKVNAYQRRFQCYEDNVAKTLLATVDEHAVGSAARPRGTKLLLTKDGGLLLDGSDHVTKSWRWNDKAQNAGTPPHEPVVISLNDVLVFTFKNRHEIAVTFSPSPDIAITFDCGEQLRRRDTYLDHATRVTHGANFGKLVLDQPAVPTLQQRQKQIEIAAIEKRSKAKPRSDELIHDQLKAIVAKLETAFDTYDGSRVTSAVGGEWKDAARRKDLGEIPTLPPTGSKVGSTPRHFGKRVEPCNTQESIQRLKHHETGAWLDAIELHDKLRQENPSLPRTGALSVASGRYMRELPVAGYVDGRKPAKTARLTLLAAAKLDAFVADHARSDLLVVVACLRTDDPQSCAMERLLEHVQPRLNEFASDPPATQAAAIGAKCRLVKCDLAESTLLADRFRIHAAPTFLLFYKGRLVQVTSLGGTSQRVFPATTNAHLSNHVDALPRVLLVENNVKQQVAVEQVLRKEAFSWDLALGGDQAAAFLTRVPLRASAQLAGGDGVHSTASITLAGLPAMRGSSESLYGIVVVSDTLSDSELRSIDRLVRSKDKTRTSGGDGGSLVCAVVSTSLTEVQFASSMCVACRRSQGRRIRVESAVKAKSETPQVCPHCRVITASVNSAIVSPVLAEVAHVFVYKHVKAATLHRLAERWVARSRPVTFSSTPAKPSADEHFTGLTVDSFFSEMERHYAAAKRGVIVPETQIPAMALSVVDAVLPATTASLRSTHPGTHHTKTHIAVNLSRSSST